MANETGGSMGGFPEQPGAAQAHQERAESQEKRWAAKSSKVAVSHACIRPSRDCRKYGPCS